MVDSSMRDIAGSWQRILWRDQTVPDNHVPSSFLPQVETAPTAGEHKLTYLVLAVLPITRHLGIISLFLSIFADLLDLSPSAVVAKHKSVLAAAVVTYFLCRSGAEGVNIKSGGSALAPFNLRAAVLLPLLLALLAPTLGTLTAATTSDSIWPLAGLLLFVHILLVDFALDSTRVDIAPVCRKKLSAIPGRVSLLTTPPLSLASSLSLTSSLSASVVLSSRLSSPAHVFLLMATAVTLFAGWPTINKNITALSHPASCAVTTLICAYSYKAIPGPAMGDRGWISTAQSLFLSVIVVVTFAGPLTLQNGWRWKKRRDDQCITVARPSDYSRDRDRDEQPIQRT